MIVLMAAANVLSGLVCLYAAFHPGYTGPAERLRDKVFHLVYVTVGALAIGSGLSTLVLIFNGVPLGAR